MLAHALVLTEDRVMALQNTTLVRIAALVVVVLGVAFLLTGQFTGPGDPDPDPGAELAERISTGSKASIDGAVPDRADPWHASHSDSPAPAAVTETAAGVPVIDLNSVTSVQEILDRLGIDRDDAEWARSRGFPWLLGSGFQLDNPYANLSVEELEALAATGDEEAKLALAMAITESDPMTAIDLYNGLAMDGNPEAMIGMGNAYGFMDYALQSPGEYDLAPGRMADIQGLAAQGIDPEIESLAWSYVSRSYIGEPRAFPGDIAADLWPTLVRACDRAVELYALIASQLAAEGRTMPDPIPVPFSPGSLDMDNMLMAACPPERLPTADFSRCRAIRIYDQGHTYDAFVCP